MEPSEAITFVRRFNAWRRCDEDSEQPHPREIGIALDALCNHAERLDRELYDARAELEQLNAILTDPLAVHLNMMRGTIKWTPANLRHLLGDTQPTTEATT